MIISRKKSGVLAALAALSLGLVAVSLAQTETRYLLPPKVVVDILDAKPLPTVIVSPTRQEIAMLDRASMPTIADLSQPMLRLAGRRINPKTNGPQRPQAVLAITLKRIADGKQVKVTAPLSPRLSNVSFSPLGSRLAFTQTGPTGIELWIADARTGAAKKVTTPTLNGTWGAPCDWVSEKEMLCQFVVAARGPVPKAPEVPAGPNIQENYGKAAPVSTYEDLLKNAHDEKLFEYYFTSQLAWVDAATGVRTPTGKPGLFEEAAASPDGKYVLVAREKRPFSRLVPLNAFPKDVEIWNRQGQLVRKIADLPLAENVPINGVPTGPRSYRWQPSAPATLVWVEALDQGDLRNKVPQRDRILALKAPFSGEPAEITRLEYRYSGISWTESGSAFISESDRTTRKRRTWILDPGGTPRRAWELSSEDRYKDPGRPVMKPRGGGGGGGGRGPFGGGEAGIIQQSGDFIYLIGAGASPQGDHPFLDRFNLKTLASDRLFQSDGESYENIEALLSPDGKTILTRYETEDAPPNYFVRNLADHSKRALTEFKDPQPQLKGVERQFVTYKRKDGVELSATLYLPPGYKKGTRLPVVMWAYPREFTDPGMAGQVSGSPHRFTTISGPSHMLFLTEGYAVFDNPTMPIVGPGETANDTYVDQLVASAQAAVDKVVEMGVGDRDRIGVGGHSYGAFMTANLLAHSRLFRAGIARSGAYNRTLTPFGFQNERRTFWEVPQIYANMSPFWFADKVKDPILLIHGEADDNSGTFPIQSERFYMALKGHGATVRYVTLPNEAHGYAARETILDVVAEMFNWFNKYVKNAAPRGQGQ
jgi:dipeptidyl aminopeptidase/acylaminoacyl peptidase